MPYKNTEDRMGIYKITCIITGKFYIRIA